MALLTTPVCDFGTKAIDFTLPGIDGKPWSLADCMGEKGLLIMFICNQCPYVKAIHDRIVRDTLALKELGIGSVAIMSNDVNDYPEDSFDNMKKIAEQLNFSFPYLLDDSQSVAKDYKAICTPDFFGYNSKLELQYRGRLDSSGKEPAATDTTRELFAAMKLIAETGQGPKAQISSMGCSIKWKSHDVL